MRAVEQRRIRRKLAAQRKVEGAKADKSKLEGAGGNKKLKAGNLLRHHSNILIGQKKPSKTGLKLAHAAGSMTEELFQKEEKALLRRARLFDYEDALQDKKYQKVR